MFYCMYLTNSLAQLDTAAKYEVGIPTADATFATLRLGMPPSSVRTELCTEWCGGPMPFKDLWAKGFLGDRRRWTGVFHFLRSFFQVVSNDVSPKHFLQDAKMPKMPWTGPKWKLNES